MNELYVKLEKLILDDQVFKKRSEVVESINKTPGITMFNPSSFY